MKPAKLIKLLYVQVIIGLVLGIMVGHYWPEIGAALKPLGDGFVKLVKMMIAPRRPSVIATTTIGSRYRLIIGLAEPPVRPATTVMKMTIAAEPSVIRAPVACTGKPRQRKSTTKSA